MALIEFVQNYEDLSTDMGYQFKFHCDPCHNGHMSRFNRSAAQSADHVQGVDMRGAANVGVPHQQSAPPQQQQSPQMQGAPPPQDYRLPGGPQAPPPDPAQQLAGGGLAACTSCGMQLGAF